MKWMSPATACCALLLSASMALADTLREVYELALANDARLKARQAQYLADREAGNLGLAALLPQVSARYDYAESDTDVRGKSIGFDRDTGSFNPIDTLSSTDVDRDGYQVSLDQALFDLPAWFDFRAGREAASEAEATFAAERQELIVRVVGAYLGVLRAREHLEASQARERAFLRQLEQTQQRFEVGLIAITDVHEAQAAYDLSRVERIADENDVNVALERLSVLTGRSHSSLHLLSDEFVAGGPQPAERDDWVDFALERNPRLKAARFKEEAARQSARASRAEHLPRVSGQLAYSDYETAGELIQRPSSVFVVSPDQTKEQESLSLRIDVPLYAGGSLSASRRRAAQEYIAARESRIQLMRDTVSDTRSLHMTVTSDVSRVAARRQSIVSSQSALDATTAGYEVGTRNIVDVLNAQNGLFAARRDYAGARFDYITSMLRLKQQAGMLGPRDIHELDGHLEPPPAATASGGSAALPAGG